MTAPADDARVMALRGSELSLVTLPRLQDCASELVDAIAAFDEDTTSSAAVSSATWLRDRAFAEHDSARTYAVVGGGQLHGFFALSVGTSNCEPAHRSGMAVGRYPIPAVLLAQAARAKDARLGRSTILPYALGAAEQVADRVAVAAMILDPFDEPTAAMWSARGFRPTLDRPARGRQQRLWRPLLG